MTAVLSDGVMVAQRALEPLVVVRIHVGQPLRGHIYAFYIVLDRSLTSGRQRSVSRADRSGDSRPG